MHDCLHLSLHELNKYGVDNLSHTSHNSLSDPIKDKSSFKKLVFLLTGTSIQVVFQN